MPLARRHRPPEARPFAALRRGLDRGRVARGISVTLLAVMAGCAGRESAAGRSKVRVDGYPAVCLDNGVIRATVFLPDRETGYYRGARFDWAGMIREVDVGGDRIFGPWAAPHDPTQHDHAVGPAEEFGTVNALGYDETAVGDAFVKIGVGELRRVSESPYRFAANYPIVRPGEWQVTAGNTSVQFVQHLAAAKGWGYEYTKSVELVPGRAELIVRHRLRNTGDRVIHTDHYCHNFFRFDDDGGDAIARIELPYEAIPETPMRLRGFLRADGQSLVITGTPPVSKSGVSELHLPADAPYAFGVLSRRKSVKVSADAPLSKFVVYVRREIVCPEPYIELDLPPQASTDWAVTYRFLRGGGIDATQPSTQAVR